jgi:hypothetical protein
MQKYLSTASAEAASGMILASLRKQIKQIFGRENDAEASPSDWLDADLRFDL